MTPRHDCVNARERDELMLRRMTLWNLVLIVILCVLVWLVLGRRNEAMYSEADCPPDCTEIHGR